MAGRVRRASPPEHLETGLRWVAYTLETELLMNEIEDATHRISHLVEAAKQYTQLDRAAHQDVDLHDGLDTTLVMLGAKLAGIDVVKEYDRDLPAVPAYPAELNQVWTNLIDNAIGAMDGAGRLTLRTARDGERALVEIGDTGPGVPPGLTRKIFEPFFTTKPVGKGTGLGLDISYRIVVAQRHGGDLTVAQRAGRHPVPGSAAAAARRARSGRGAPARQSCGNSRCLVCCGWEPDDVRSERGVPVRRICRGPGRGPADDGVHAAARPARRRPVAAGSGRVRPPPAEDHRPDQARLAADARCRPRPHRGLQRLHLQLP